ncbi:hypothetical protein L3X38_025251 [Prunus dulcis]|uniref:Uncharacterized protein n=1 Tax=Prunus dulcis TaxID=3755 RepID=A0AAD4W1G8_PRUDU|nr:hypothetical protein L3X38_025251 [Prunus dulcis]
MLTQALSKTGQPRDLSLCYADQTKRIGAINFYSDGDPVVAEEGFRPRVSSNEGSNQSSGSGNRLEVVQLEVLGDSCSQQRGRGGRSRATGKVYNMSQQEAQVSPYVIVGILPVFGISARVLIDPGATHSFVTPSFDHNANVRL